MLFALCAVAISSAQAKDDLNRKHIEIVGSSTVFPYTQRVAKAYAERYGGLDPIVQTSGSGAGIRKFCKGIGLQHPDIANASRSMKPSEWNDCVKNGVDDITEIKFGHDGLTLVKSRFGEAFNITLLQLYKAVAKKVPVSGNMVTNPNRIWSDIDPSLPPVSIQVFGPTNNHGSYGIFIKKVLLDSCNTKIFLFQVKKVQLKDKEKYLSYIDSNCTDLRTDGSYIGVDQPFKQTLKLLLRNPTAMALVGYSELFNRRSSLQAVRLEGIEPRIYTIADQTYALSRPLYFYIKNTHRELLPGITSFAKEFMSEQAMGSFGYLTRMGLGVLSVEQLNRTRYSAIIGSKMRRYVD